MDERINGYLETCTLCVYLSLSIYIYIYIYIERERERERVSEIGRGGGPPVRLGRADHDLLHSLAEQSRWAALPYAIVVITIIIIATVVVIMIIVMLITIILIIIPIREKWHWLNGHLA